jgi:hypothetical protein
MPVHTRKCATIQKGLKKDSSPVYSSIVSFVTEQAKVKILNRVQFPAAITSFCEYALPILSIYGGSALDVIITLFYRMFPPHFSRHLKRSVTEGIWADLTLGWHWSIVFLRAARDIYPRDPLPFTRNRHSKHVVLRKPNVPLLPIPNHTMFALTRRLDQVLADQIERISTPGGEHLATGIWLSMCNYITDFYNGPITLDSKAIAMLQADIGPSSPLDSPSTSTVPVPSSQTPVTNPILLTTSSILFPFPPSTNLPYIWPQHSTQGKISDSQILPSQLIRLLPSPLLHHILPLPAQTALLQPHR